MVCKHSTLNSNVSLTWHRLSEEKFTFVHGEVTLQNEFDFGVADIIEVTFG